MNIENEIKKIEERNRRVELDKAWETSGFRMTLVLIFTYMVAVVFLILAEIPDPYQNGFVPVLAYLISNLSLPPIKKWWIRRYEKTSK